MQNTSRITRTKSGSMFIPKSHKSSRRSTVDSVCPTPAVNKHADPNRRRVIAVDSEFELTPTPTTVSKKRKSPEREKCISSNGESSEPSLRKRMKMSTPDSEKSNSSRSGSSSSTLIKAGRTFNKVETARVRSAKPPLENSVAGPIPDVVVCEEKTTESSSHITIDKMNTSDESESPFGDIFLHPEPWRRIDEILGMGPGSKDDVTATSL